VRTISLRQFRDTIGDLQEPVQIVKRQPDGSIWTIGEYHPISTATDNRALDAIRPGEPPSTTTASAGFSTRPFTPVPKRGRS
jgi:hypothetical protein